MGLVKARQPATIRRTARRPTGHQIREAIHVDDAIYNKAVEKFGERGVMDLVAVNGYYDAVSMTLNVAHVAPPAGEEMPFKQAGR